MPGDDSSFVDKIELCRLEKLASENVGCEDLLADTERIIVVAVVFLSFCSTQATFVSCWLLKYSIAFLLEINLCYSLNL